METDISTSKLNISTPLQKLCGKKDQIPHSTFFFLSFYSSVLSPLLLSQKPLPFSEKWVSLPYKSQYSKEKKNRRYPHKHATNFPHKNQLSAGSKVGLHISAFWCRICVELLSHITMAYQTFSYPAIPRSLFKAQPNLHSNPWKIVATLKHRTWWLSHPLPNQNPSLDGEMPKLWRER